MDENGTKYLGIVHACSVTHSRAKELLSRELTARTKELTSSELNMRNLIDAINLYISPVLVYSFGAVAWAKNDVQHLERAVVV